MSVVIVGDRVSEADLAVAKEDYGDYIKFVVDVETWKLAIGGEWHVDAEKVLLENGSRQDNLWGGGINLVSKEIDFKSLINTRPNFNNSQEVIDEKIRHRMSEIVRTKFGYE